MTQSVGGVGQGHRLGNMTLHAAKVLLCTSCMAPASSATISWLVKSEKRTMQFTEESRRRSGRTAKTRRDPMVICSSSKRTFPKKHKNIELSD